MHASGPNGVFSAPPVHCTIVGSPGRPGRNNPGGLLRGGKAAPQDLPRDGGPVPRSSARRVPHVRGLSRHRHVFAHPSHAAIHRARLEGFSARMFRGFRLKTPVCGPSCEPRNDGLPELRGYRFSNGAPPLRSDERVYPVADWPASRTEHPATHVVAAGRLHVLPDTLTRHYLHVTHVRAVRGGGLRRVRSRRHAGDADATAAPDDHARDGEYVPPRARPQRLRLQA